MKQLIMVNGTMGVGKTTTCKLLSNYLQPSVFLDGDWCWDMHPFLVNEETKEMVLNNITYVLNQFLACTQFEYVIFCWVMHEQAILDEVCSRLSLNGVKTSFFSLICEEDILRQRLEKDVEAGIRNPDVIARTLPRLPLYQSLNTIKVDVSNQSSESAARCIADQIQKQK